MTHPATYFMDDGVIYRREMVETPLFRQTQRNDARLMAQLLANLQSAITGKVPTVTGSEDPAAGGRAPSETG